MANKFDEDSIRLKWYALKAKSDNGEQITAADMLEWKGVIENAVTLEAVEEQPVEGAMDLGPEFSNSLRVHHALLRNDEDFLRTVGSLHELILQTDADNIDQALEWFIPAFTDMVAPGGEAVLDIAGHDPQFYDENNN